jgi:DNA-binding NtrC family response regulator
MDSARILIVDDDEDTCENLSDILTGCGYEADVANKGSDALNLVDLKEYDLALLDFRLPCMTGVELFRQIKEHAGALPAVLVTAYATQETRDDAAREGIYCVMKKPVEIGKLVSVVQQIVDSPA